MFYGTSETSFVTVSDADTPEGSVGRAYPGVELKVNADGLIYALSPMLFRDYLFSGGALTRRRDGYISVGDLGRIDADGFVWLTGRADRVVSISDRTVSLDAIEAQIAKATGITQVAVVALRDAKRGHALGVALRGDPELVSRQAAELPKMRRIIQLAQWPMLASGKTDYTAIEALFADNGQ